MPFVVGGAILGGALISGVAGNMAAGQQADAARNASNIGNQQFQQTRQDLLPWMNAGQRPLQDLTSLTAVQRDAAGNPILDQSGALIKPFGLSDFQASPAYQFNLQQGQMALDKAANARGNYYAPQTLQDISKFSQGLASNEFTNAYNMYNQNQSNIFNRLYGMSGSGQNAAAQLGGFGANNAAMQGQAAMGVGNANAAGIMGVGNALTGGLQNAYNAYQGNQNTVALNAILAQMQQGQGGNPYGYGMNAQTWGQVFPGIGGTG